MSDLDDLAAAAGPQRQVPQTAGLVSSGSVIDRVWTVHDQGRQLGPHTEQELAMLLTVGTVSQSALVWRTGSPRWIPITAIVPIPTYPSSISAHAPSQVIAGGAAYRGQPTNRIAAGVLGSLLGGLGIHKFILGFTTAGLVMLLVSVLTFGVGWCVMAVIGLIEGIIYLTKSDADFYREYVVGKSNGSESLRAGSDWLSFCGSSLTESCPPYETDRPTPAQIAIS